MLFALNIEKHNSSRFLDKFKNIFKLNKINIVVKKYDCINITSIEVNLRHGSIPWKKIIKILGDNKKILCSDDIYIPSKFGIHRYISSKLNVKLCKNSVLEILKLANLDKKSFKLVIYDPYGNHVDFLSKLINFSRNIIVVTDNKEIYEEEQLDLLREYGISILVTDNRDWIYNSNLIVAPEKISEPLQVSFNSIVFTGEKSQYSLSCRIYDKYEIANINKYKEIMPKNLNINYFLNIIYDKYNLKDLDNMIPKYCYYYDKKITLESISNNLVL